MTTYVYWVRGAEFAEMAKLSIASIPEEYANGHRVIVYTDEASPSWANGFSTDELRQIKPGRPAMVANLDANVDAILSAPRGEPMLFLDADTLMRRPFPWAADIDLYATWRDHVNGDREAARFQPWNYGVLGAIANPATIEAFIWLRARVMQMSQDRQNWYGNQLALADLLGAARPEPWTARIRWTLTDEGTPLRVMPLPCETWNWSPDSADSDSSGKGIIHCKGNRKDLMQHFAAAA